MARRAGAGDHGPHERSSRRRPRPGLALLSPVRFGAARRVRGAPLLVVSVHGRDPGSEGAASDEPARPRATPPTRRSPPCSRTSPSWRTSKPRCAPSPATAPRAGSTASPRRRAPPSSWSAPPIAAGPREASSAAPPSASSTGRRARSPSCRATSRVPASPWSASRPAVARGARGAARRAPCSPGWRTPSCGHRLPQARVRLRRGRARGSARSPHNEDRAEAAATHEQRMRAEVAGALADVPERAMRASTSSSASPSSRWWTSPAISTCS